MKRAMNAAVYAQDDGLALNIDVDNNTLDIELDKSVGSYFCLEEKEMNTILDEVKSSVSGGQRLAGQTGVSRNEQILMSATFRV
jgi:serine/threonine-protein kinase HipA